ncbi:MAG: hypothetical protein EBY14_11630 [Betaproteobacteria bacterium]|nr:hypothetical protein [Betaproteobacteria bacterium]NDB41029.1 hypothetical protein [Betaproteobacteria bacterium]NDF92275.1 hypothetical protein [Betaproteobacteria bacterium]
MVVVTAPTLSLLAVPLIRRLPKAKAPFDGEETVTVGVLLMGTLSVVDLEVALASYAVITTLWDPEPTVAASSVNR